jgi:cytochrome c553
MKIINLRLALQTVILAIVFFAAGRSNGADTSAVSRGNVQAKVEYCKDCHGLSGQGYRGFFSMPRLAGQPPEYLENQLRAFAERRRDKDILINMAKVHGLSPTMRTALAAHFRTLDPRPVGGAPRELLATGKTIYQEGVPEANIPACSACHGPEAKGQEAIPRLAGQLYLYTIKQLTDWGKERAQGLAKDDASAIMAPVARSLTKSQIAAIAAYLSYQE